MNRVTIVVLGAAAVAGGALVARWQTTRRFTDEPRFEVLRQLEPAVEIRRYEAVVVAETRVPGSLETATSVGFRRLAGYIFGGNRQRESLAMTTPVAVESERLAMTTPVTVESAEGEHLVTFVMPAGRALDSLPVPNDERVTLREIPARSVAVFTYAGRTTPEIIERHTASLRGALARAELSPIGGAISSRYDPPWTLPMLRRNEIWIPIAD